MPQPNSFLHLLHDQLAELSSSCRSLRSIHEGTGLILADCHRLLGEAQRPSEEQDPEELLEALVRVATACARLAQDVVLPALDATSAD